MSRLPPRGRLDVFHDDGGKKNILLFLYYRSCPDVAIASDGEVQRSIRWVKNEPKSHAGIDCNNNIIMIRGHTITSGKRNSGEQHNDMYRYILPLG